MYSDPLGHHTLSVLAKAQQFNHWMYTTIRPHLKGDILEIGSGIGNISRYVLEADLSLTVSDYDTGYCKHLQNTFGHFPNLKGVRSIDLQHPNFYDEYSMLKERFDTVYLLNVLEHLADADIAIANCTYLLKPHGNLIILVPAYPFLYCNLDVQLQHYKRYTMRDLKKLHHQQQLKLIHMQHFNALGIAGWMLYGKILNRKSLQESEVNTYNAVIRIAKFMDRFFKNKVGLSIITVAQKP
jgi:2-polyprenyl-3-methyl-5-hydroxy-6-metoxy-1,4-benzoquinol methylase